MAVCSMSFIDLNINQLNILSTFFAYNERQKEEKNCKTIRHSAIIENMENENLTVAGKIVVFKIIVISRIVFQSFITTVGTWCK